MIAFNCTFAADIIAFVWIRDHLVCHTRPVPFGNSPSSTDGSPEYPLPVKKGQVDPLVVHVYNTGANKTSAINIQWVSSSPSRTHMSLALSPSFIIRRVAAGGARRADEERVGSPHRAHTHIQPITCAPCLRNPAPIDAGRTKDRLVDLVSIFTRAADAHHTHTYHAGLTTCSASHDSPTHLR
jgi:hypothetical protein